MKINIIPQRNQLKGKGTKISIIDSGININSPHINKIKKGIGIYYKGDKFIYNKDIYDENGHGTKICDILLSIAPDVDLYIARIFKKHLIAEVDCLVKAIEWSIKMKVNIINVSLGTTSTRNIQELKYICHEAYKNNIFIISSLDSRNKISYPGWHTNVFCVYNKIHQRIKGNKKYLLGICDQNLRNNSNSYLVPIVTAYTALLCDRNQSMDFNYLFKQLKTSLLL